MSDSIEFDPNDFQIEPGEERTPYRQCAEGYTRVRMHVSYDGTDFLGWQRQTKHVSVQGTLEKILTQISTQPIRVLGASRTDTGVHAIRQVAHFDWPKNPEGWDFRYAIQSMAPESLVVTDLFVAPRDFHAIALVTDKVYKYRIYNQKVPNPIRRRYSHWVRFPLDLDYLNEASQFFVGKQDFKSFQTSGTIVKSTIRHVSEAHWSRINDDEIEFTIRGDGFLKQMVRNIVGTVIDLNQGNQPASKVRTILDHLDRRKAGPTAPPQGLFLERVNYPEDVDNKCRKI